MIAKQLDKITREDIERLIIDGVAERKNIEYKQQLPERNDAAKREFLADVSSFANTSGGDLIFGMVEVGGIATALNALRCGDLDEQMQWFNNVIQSGLSPRIRYNSHAIKLDDDKYVIIFRIEQSWYGPHRVVFRQDGRFYARTTNGKYELDVNDLRNAFTSSNSVFEKLANFRSDRLIAISNGSTSVPLPNGPKLVIHVLPVEAFGRTSNVDVLQLKDIPPLYPRGLSSWRTRTNFDGRVCVAAGREDVAYTQVFRSGAIEAVQANLLPCYEAPLSLNVEYEFAAVNFLPECFEILKALGCNPPVVVAISLLGVRGMRIPAGGLRQLEIGSPAAITQDHLLLPELMVDTLEPPPAGSLKSTLDLVWNACGYEESLLFDRDGNWLNGEWRKGGS